MQRVILWKARRQLGHVFSVSDQRTIHVKQYVCAHVSKDARLVGGSWQMAHRSASAGEAAAEPEEEEEEEEDEELEEAVEDDMQPSVSYESAVAWSSRAGATHRRGKVLTVLVSRRQRLRGNLGMRTGDRAHHSHGNVLTKLLVTGSTPPYERISDLRSTASNADAAQRSERVLDGRSKNFRRPNSCGCGRLGTVPWR